ncbi:MAG: serine hydrolase domain-containing protein [Steroidobacteraceae bacterium]
MYRLCLILCCLVVASCQGAGGGLRAAIDQRIDSGEYLGAVALVERHGRIVELHAAGHRDLARTAAMDVDAIFRIYSMTKTVATVGALVLADRGVFGLDDPVARFLPEFAGLQVLAGGSADAPTLRAARRPLTIRHLLIHAAGFAVGGDDAPAAVELLRRAALDDAADMADYCRRLAAVPLATDPGTRFNYDGVQFVVLGRLIEVAAGMPLDRFLQENVFAPLRMHDTGFAVPSAARGRIAEMTSTDVEGRLIASPEYAGRMPGELINRFPSAAGGLYSTARDFHRFSRMLLNGGSLDGARILERATVAEMMSNQLPRLDPPATEFRPGAGFGLGGEIVTDPARRGVAGSAGMYGWPGAASTWYFIHPSQELIAILLMQHLPQGLPRDPPKPGTAFYNQVYRSHARQRSP